MIGLAFSIAYNNHDHHNAPTIILFAAAFSTFSSSSSLQMMASSSTQRENYNPSKTTHTNKNRQTPRSRKNRSTSSFHKTNNSQSSRPKSSSSSFSKKTQNSPSPPTKIKILSKNELDQLSLGEAITKCQIPNQCLYLSTHHQLWIPTDENLPSHYQHQPVHHEKRQRWASLLLEKLYTTTFTTTGTQSHQNNIDYRIKMGRMLWKDQRMARMILACAIPYIPNSSKDEEYKSSFQALDLNSDRISKEGRYISQALFAIHALLSYSYDDSMNFNHHRPTKGGLFDNDDGIDSKDFACHQIIEGIQLLIIRAENMAIKYPLHDVIQVRWAIRGILARLVSTTPEDVPIDSPYGRRRIPLISIDSLNKMNSVSIFNDDEQWKNDITQETRKALKESDWTKYLSKCIPSLEKRVSNLPFDIIPLGVDWSKALSSSSSTTKHQSKSILSLLRQSIPFQYDTITTKTGSLVKKRRQTAWLADTSKKIGALAYSGKLMAPNPIPSLVQDSMRIMEQIVLSDSYDLEEYHIHGFFDCTLCNYYPNANAACKFHTDPEHGSFWDRLTCVVAAGEERRFAFRPIPGLNTWSHWDSVSSFEGKTEENKPVVIHLFSGDVVKMWGSCNDDFHHAVYHSLGGGGVEAKEDILEDEKEDVGRVSLVFKRAIAKGNGRRGHSIQGEGRRSRRKR